MMRIRLHTLVLAGFFAGTALSPLAARAQQHPLRESDITTALGYTPPQIGTTTGTARDAGAAIAAENSKVGLDTNNKVAAAALVNRPVIAALTTTVGTTPTTIYPAKNPPDYYVRVRITLNTQGPQVVCTADGTTPVLGTSIPLSASGMYLYWDWEAPPTGPVQCIASATASISPDAR